MERGGPQRSDICDKEAVMGPVCAQVWPGPHVHTCVFLHVFMCVL